MHRNAIGTAFLPVYLGQWACCVYLKKISSKTGSIISMQARLAADQVQASLLQQTLWSHISFRPHDFVFSCSVISARHKDSPRFFPPQCCCCRYTTAFCGTQLTVLFCACTQLSFLSLLLRCLSRHVSLYCLPVSTSITALLMHFFFPIFSLVLSLFSPGDRVQVTDDSNEEWWKVGNKSLCKHVRALVGAYL